jgi:KRAB domain-containing zinc finger protein
VNLGLNENSENSKLNDGTKYHKREQTSETSCGQLISPDQQEAKDKLQGSKQQHRCMLCNCAYIQREKMMLHMHKKHAGLFILCKHNGHCAEIFRTEAEKSEHIIELRNKNANLIKCDFCSVMHSKSHTTMHLKKHHKNENFIQCSYRLCAIRFRSEVEKQNHEALVHESAKKHKCIFCNLFYNETTIVHHYQAIHKSLLAKAFKCKFKCRKYFLTEADLEEHIASAHKKCLMRAEAKCLYCNKVCIDKDVLKNHINRHHSAVKILCKFFNCRQYFHTQIEADKHFEQLHQKIEENKKYRCLKCNYRADYKQSVKFHNYRMHEEKLLPCSKCSRCFSSSFTLKYHIKHAHSPQEVCPHCHKSYLHIRIHLKQEKCKRCQKVLLCVCEAQLHKTLCKL